MVPLYLESNYPKSNEFVSVETKPKYNPDLLLEPKHQQINLTFDINQEKIDGWVKTTILANSSKGKTIELDAINFTIMKVESISKNGKEEISWRYDDKKILIRWNSPWIKNEERDLVITYSVKNPIGGLYFSHTTENDPTLPVFVGADHESERARYWLPCIDHPSVRCTLEMSYTSDSNHTILSNGQKIDETIENGKKTTTWKLDYPCPSYLITLFIGEMIEYKDRPAKIGSREVPISYFALASKKEDYISTSFNKTPMMLEWLSKKLGFDYPFPKYYQCFVPMTGGAMENISLVRWNEEYVPDEILAKEDQYRLDQVNLHEMAHHWFGDTIVIKNFGHAWIKESMVSYLETIYLEEHVSKQDADYYRFKNESDYFAETKKYVRPIATNKYETSWDMYDRHLYPGGSQRLDMLRKMLGEENFFDALKEYLELFQKNIAETSDLQRVLEKHSGQNLQQFFDQWIYGKGFPDLEIKQKISLDNDTLELTVKQNQVNKEKGIDLFTFTLEVLVHRNNGSELLSFPISNQENLFIIHNAKTIDFLDIDPDYKLLIKFQYNPGFEQLKNIITSGSTKNKIYASMELSKDPSIQKIEFLVSQINSVEFWGLKLEFIKTLAEISDKKAFEELLGIITSESNPMVLNKAVQTLDKIKLDFIAPKLKQLIDKQNPYYYKAYGSLLEEYASYRTPESFNLLTNLSIPKDKYEIVEKSRLLAIGKLRSKEAADYLLNKFKKREFTYYSEGAIITSLSESVMWLDGQIKDEVIEELSSYINEAHYQVALRSLANALDKLEVKNLIELLEKIKLKMPYQYHTPINRLIEKAKNPPKENNNKNIEERLSKLEKENIELKNKISKLELLNAGSK